MPNEIADQDKELASHLIDKYREIIEVRYAFDDMNRRLDLPPELTKEVVDAVRDYFLNHIYPTAARRAELEMAFRKLGGYISQPAKIWRLLGSMTSAVFKFGRHFPAALKAGFVSLQSYADAKEFESTLLKSAKDLNMHGALTNEQFIECLAQIPREDVNDFMKVIHSLFTSLTNSILLAKTMGIMQSVISKMKKYPHVYPEDEIQGIYLGIDILENGHKLFANYDERTKKLVVQAVMDNELDFQNEIYKS